MATSGKPTERDLAAALKRRRVMTLLEIRQVLGDVSVATACRRLRRVSYRRSYNFNGRYYTFDDETRYDRLGLWSYEGIRFSRDGSLSATVKRLVEASEAGSTQRELQEILGVRVQNVLKALIERSELYREAIDRLFIYLHSDPEVRRQQLARRREAIAARQQAEIPEVAFEVVVAILLVLIRHPGSDPAAVTRRLRGRSPPVGLPEVRRVFERYQLGQKKGLSSS